MQEIKLNGESMNIVEDNIEKLKTIFPDVFTERKVDFEKLQGVLGNYIETNDERYNFTWAGKQNALRLAQTPSTGTLRPCKEESKNWDTTQNLYIEGDNLEVLKLLQKSYHNKIKMIYIDPPYNTGNDFVYKDDFKDNIENYKKITGQVDEEGNKISSNSESDGRYHTNWLNMMYPRLKLARNLLSENGIIFVSIDEYEITNLLKIMNEIFGDNNNLGQIIWDKRNPKGETVGVAAQHEYILVYCKNKNRFAIEDYFYRDKEHATLMLNKVKKLISKNNEIVDANVRNDYNLWLKEHKNDFSGGELAYKYIDDNGDIYRPVSMAAPDKPETRSHRALLHPITQKECPVPEKGWRYTDETMDLYIKKDLILFGINEKTQPNRKYLLKDNIKEGVPSLLYYGGSGGDDCFNLPFDNPKPVYLIKRLIAASTTQNDIILDFFSGSATTAHACLEQVLKDNITRKFMLVQLPELTYEYSNGKKKVLKTAQKAFDKGYYNICQIAKERIKCAGEKIKQEIEQGNQQLKLGEEPKKVPDIGFKVFKLDSSNIKKWNANTENLEKEMQSSIFNYVEDRSELDIVYEVMLKCGLNLTYPIEEIKVEDKTLYSVGAGAMFICMDDRITQSIADKIIAIKEENEIEEPVVVFKDNGFVDDSTKTNIKESLRVAGIKDFITV